MADRAQIIQATILPNGDREVLVEGRVEAFVLRPSEVVAILEAEVPSKGFGIFLHPTDRFPVCDSNRANLIVTHPEALALLATTLPNKASLTDWDKARTWITQGPVRLVIENGWVTDLSWHTQYTVKEV